MKKTGLFALLVFICFIPQKAQAEFCWKIGCKGSTGYIFIPDPQLWEEEKTHITINGKEYELDYPEDRPVFKKLGLPKIGEQVTLSVPTPLYNSDRTRRGHPDTTEINKRKRVFQKKKKGLQNPKIWPPDEGEIEPWSGSDTSVLYGFPTTGDGSYPLPSDAIVEILGYKTFVFKGDDNQYLFAKVKVIDHRTDY